METAAARMRLLVIDIDGTLLTPEGTITAPTLAAVQAVQQAGRVVTLGTHTTELEGQMSRNLVRACTSFSYEQRRIYFR